MLRVVTDDERRGDAAAGLDEIVREGARRMLAAALEAEADAYVAALVGELDEAGHRLVVRNGHAESRTITTAAGAVEIQAPRVNDRRFDPDSGERCRFRSAIVPPWCRKSPKVAEVLPLMYLHGLSSGDFVPALTEFFGSGAGLSAPGDHPADQDLAGRAGCVHVPGPVRAGLRVLWADGVHFRVRLEEANLCCPGHRGCPCRRDQGARGHRGRPAGVHRVLGRPAAGPQAPGHAGSGAGGRATERSGSGGAAQGVPRHRPPTLLGAQGRQHSERAAQSGSRRPDAIWPTSATPRTATTPVAAINAFATEFGAKWPKAVAKIVDDAEELLAFFDFPAEHWIHLKTSNPIESTFSTVRLRTKVTKGPGSRAAGLAMAFKLIESAQARWRAVNGAAPRRSRPRRRQVREGGD